MATSPDRMFSAIIRVNGSEDTDWYRCINRITVEEDLETGSSFEIEVVLDSDEDGAYPDLDDENLRPWNRITIIAGFPDHEDTIMDGYISHLNPATDSSGNQPPVLRIRGVDASYAMNLEERLRVWEGMTYEQIATEIINTYEHTPFVQEPAEGEESAEGDQLPSVTQRSTDHRFLRELARRKGYEFYMRGAEVHFHLPELSGTPQKVIAVNFGEQTNCDDLNIEVDGTRPTRAQMTWWDPLAGGEPPVEPITETDSGLELLGTTGLSQLRGQADLPQTTIIVRHHVAASENEARDYLRGVLRRNGWFVKATGSLGGSCYGRVLRSKKLVTIKGLGTTYNGNYYVKKVTHKIEQRNYVMEFEAYRNALGELGSEDFTAEMPSAGAPLAVTADTDQVVVLDSGGRVMPAA